MSDWEVEDNPQLHWTPRRLPIADRYLPANYYGTHIAYVDQAVKFAGEHMVMGHTACGISIVIRESIGIVSYDTEVTCYSCYMSSPDTLDPVEAVVEAEMIIRGLG